MECKLPADLEFTPSNPESLACKLGQHTPLWSSALVASRRQEYSPALGKHTVRTLQQIGRCTKCGAVGAEVAEESVVELQHSPVSARTV